MTAAAVLMGVARALVLAALVYAVAVAVTHWAVRSRRLNPFGRWPRLVRRASDPVLRPIERRVHRAGGNPQDAPLWLLGIVVIGGLLLLSLLNWLIGFTVRLEYLSAAGPRAWVIQIVNWAFTIVMVALFVRVIGSWFGVSRYTRWMRPAYILTDWIVEPIRRVMPPFGMLDLSPLVAYLVLLVGRSVVMGLLR